MIVHVSCWNENDANRAKLLVLREDQCSGQVGVAFNVLDGLMADPTNGAGHYHTIDSPFWTRAWPPDWAASIRETARFGGHVFYDSRHAHESHAPFHRGRTHGVPGCGARS